MASTDPGGLFGASEAADRARQLVRRLGTTFCEDAGIQLADDPAPLWQLLVLTQLLSARIASTAAIASARELLAIGCTTPDGLLSTTWRQRVDALGRGGYRRYDFSTATRLQQNATMVRESWHGDLRELHGAASSTDNPAREVARLLRTIDGIGATGASIFVREVQAVWPDVRPAVDPLVRKGAALCRLDADHLADLVPGDDLARLCAALVRVARKPGLASTG